MPEDILPGTVLPKAILFDWDNTLIESWNTIHQAWNATLSDFGLPIMTLTETRARVRLSARESFPQTFAEHSEQAISLYRKYYQDFHVTPEPLDSAECILKFCRGQEIPCGVISNKSHDFLQQEIIALEWQNYFSLGIIGAGKARADKPDPAVLEALLPDMTSCHDYWYIGDTGVDIEFAHRCGMIGVLVGDNTTSDDVQPVKNFDDLSSLLFELKALSL